MRHAPRIIFVLVLAFSAAAFGGARSAHAAASAQYIVEGRGWGHGIGMSQYGADGYAAQGWSVEQIIQHYYTGTVLATRPADGRTQFKVLLQSGLAPARVRIDGNGVVKQGLQSVALQTGDVVEMRNIGGLLVTSRVRAGEPNVIVAGGSAEDAVITPETDGTLVTLFKGDYARMGTTYRGTFTAHLFDNAVSVVNNVPVEDYVRGVVPNEMPASWRPEAVKAQAVAARAYALTRKPNGYGWFDLYSDTRSQVYGGSSSEQPESDVAVAATSGLVPRVSDANGAIAETFFFSTSGGSTAGNDEVWGSAPISYLRPVASPYETASKKFVWSGSDIKRLTPAALGTALGLGSGVRAVASTWFGSGYVKSVTVTTARGAVAVKPTTFQSRLGLNSTWFRVRYLSIGAPSVIGSGGLARIGGRAPAGLGTQVKLIYANGATKVLPVKVAANGAWVIRARVPVNLTATMLRGGVPGPRITITAAS